MIFKAKGIVKDPHKTITLDSGATKLLEINQEHTILFFANLCFGARTLTVGKFVSYQRDPNQTQKYVCAILWFGVV